MTDTIVKHLAVWRYIGRYGRVMSHSKVFSSEAEARRHCQRMKRAGCLDATFRKI